MPQLFVTHSSYKPSITLSQKILFHKRPGLVFIKYNKSFGGIVRIKKVNALQVQKLNALSALVSQNEQVCYNYKISPGGLPPLPCLYAFQNRTQAATGRNSLTQQKTFSRFLTGGSVKCLPASTGTVISHAVIPKHDNDIPFRLQ